MNHFRKELKENIHNLIAIQSANHVETAIKCYNFGSFFGERD